ncbi:AAA domain-containing protein [Nitrosospira briensis]|uniref:AAA domain-containing protein n=1 Tax=Nitrosospira briensis TaxID=35799 RepID=A0A1I5B461_9PROT|nr:AAA family ATPase [Nitrosospira briensis]SFN69390.1 AAA domain-containing protein [Nitrosospira briensis]
MANDKQGIERGAAALDKIIKGKFTREQQEHIDRGKGIHQAPKSRLKLTRASDIVRMVITWLWWGKIALGKITLIAGDPGLGKSTVTVSLAAHVSTGLPWPDGTPCPHGDVIFISAEDDAADTICPRMDAAGADSSRIHIVGGVESLNRSGDPETRLLSLRRDIEAVREAILALPECRLIIVDPISAYLDGSDSHNNAEVRALMAPLSELAASIGAALIFVTHLNKGTGGSALQRATGSMAFVAAARAAFLVAADKSDPARRLFIPLKNNLGPDGNGMAYRIEVVNGVSRVAWEKESISISADEALGRDDDAGGHETTLAGDAADWLSDVLSAGAVSSNDVKKHAKEAGYSWATIRRAQAALGVKPQRVGGAAGDGAWVWTLPDEHKNPQMTLKEAGD